MGDLRNVDWTGPSIDDPDILSCLPKHVARVLEQFNGFVQFSGGLHVRGACRAPLWHSLRHAWFGEEAFCNLYDGVRSADIPFAEDALGDQFLLREGVVHCLAAETGEIGALDLSFAEFLREAQANPVDVLQLQTLLQYLDHASPPRPGQLLEVEPPFCTEAAQEGVSLRPVPALERRRALANFARRAGVLPDGTPVQRGFVEP